MTDQDDVKAAATAEAADEARDNRAHRKILIFGIAGAIFVILSCGVSVLALRHSGDQATQISDQGHRIDKLIDTSNEAAKKSQQLADQIVRLGATPVVQPAVPAPAGPTIVPVPIPGPGPTQAQIDDAVAAYLAAHPPAAGKSVTPAMVATAVGDFLTVHPPEPGRPPTPEEIATAASNYIAAHVADFRGTPGKNGSDGTNATDAQVKAAVSAYCDAHGSCAGAAGQTGQTGKTGPPGPTCPPGYELRDAVITAPNGSTYQGKACVDPATSKPPSTLTIPTR
jgi:hypothetical protein